MKSLSIPAAIVAGFGILGVASGLGLYFGLRARPVAPVDSIPSIATTLSGATARASEPVAAATASTPVASSAVVTEAAREAIQAQHDHLVDKCWNPSFARNPLPARVSYSLIIQYADDGRLAMHSLKAEVPGARTDVTSCVFSSITIPNVSPPGHRMSVTVPMTFP